MIQVEKITDILGLSCQIHSLYELNESVALGLPKKSLQTTVKHLTLDTDAAKQISNKLVPPASFKRRKDNLNPQQSERVERMARVFATALDVWGDEDDARKFLFSSHQLLNHQRPIDFAFSELGARHIEEILEKLRYGLPV